MSKTFCALPFQHLCVGPEGTARTCCVSHDLVSEHGAPMSLNVHSMDEIWNSAYMRNIRRGMLRGERISACEVCYESEAASGQSYRTHTGSEPIAGRPVSLQDMQKYSATGYRVAERAKFIKLEISNLCNLKCRMCYGAASSQIERDPVHSRWSGGVDPMHAVWRGATARIGPEPRIGVRSSGMHKHGYVDGEVCAWTDGHATFNIPVQPGTRLASIEVGLHASGLQNQSFQIICNGKPAFRGIADASNATVTLDLSKVDCAGELTLEVISNRRLPAGGGAEIGVLLSSLVLTRMASASSMLSERPVPLSPRPKTPGPWFMDDETVFNDVLKAGHQLERLYITGGEPLINDRVADILDHLIDIGAASGIHLELSTNCTHLDQAHVERFKKFRRVELLLSLDAVGEVYEYIRHPARWRSVDATVRGYKAQGIVCKVPPVVQVYNVLNLVELYRYCDELDMEVTMNILHMPSRLAIQHLTPSVRQAAAAKLMAYHDSDCRPFSKPQVLSLARYLAEMTTPPDPAIIREFMLFTNDLDATRGQDIARSCPELVQLMARDGFEWTRETRFAHGPKERAKRANERDYAWL